MEPDARSAPSKPVEARAPERPAQHLASFETVLLAGGVVLFLAMLYSMAVSTAENRFLSPLLLLIAIVALVWPLHRTAPARALFLAAGLLFALWFVDALSGILTPFAIVYLLAFLFDPLVTKVYERYGVPRFVSSLVLTLLLVGLLVLVVLLVVPQLFKELQDLAVRALGTVTHIREWIVTTTLLDDLEAAGMIDKQVLVRDLSTAIQQRLGSLANSIPTLAQRLVGYVTSLFGIVTIVAIVPVIFYYTLKDYPFIKRRLVGLFPTFGGQHDYLVKAGTVVGSYLRGQLTISAIGAFNVSVVLLLFNVPYALIIGLLTGILNLIPNLGAIITNVIAVVMMLVFGRDPWYRDVLIVVSVLGAQSLLEQAVLTPKILSHSVGLHPVLIILSLFVFAHFLGLFGLIIAVPATALLMAYYKSKRDGWNFDVPRPASRTTIWRRRLGVRGASRPGSDAGEGDA